MKGYGMWCVAHRVVLSAAVACPHLVCRPVAELVEAVVVALRVGYGDHAGALQQEGLDGRSRYAAPLVEVDLDELAKAAAGRRAQEQRERETPIPHPPSPQPTAE